MAIKALWLICALFAGIGNAEAALPLSPCAGSGAPFQAAPGAAPAIAIWHGSELEQGKWQPPPCTGWAPASRSKLVVTLAGSFAFSGTMDQLVARAGAISALRTVQYWSTTDKKWRPLAYDAAALTGPDAKSRRGDFTAAELVKGANFYYWENDSRSGAIVYRMQVNDRTQEGVLIVSENVTPVRSFYLTMFRPGALQSLISIQRQSPGIFGVYILSRTGEGTSALAEGHEESYVNRAAALYRQIAGIKTDQEPPAAR